MGISKAFDSIPNSLKIAKCHAYGISLSSCDLLTSYVSRRKQRVKINQSNKSPKAPVSYPTIHHFGTQMCTFLFQSGVLLSIGQVHCGISEIGLLEAMKVDGRKFTRVFLRDQY